MYAGFFLTCVFICTQVSLSKYVHVVAPLYMLLFVYVRACRYALTSTCVAMHKFACLCACYVSACMCIRGYASMCICVNMYMCRLHMNVCSFLHTRKRASMHGLICDTERMLSFCILPYINMPWQWHTKNHDLDVHLHAPSHTCMYACLHVSK